MNKKFSTLAASALLATAFSANAQDVKVTDASQLINGGQYKLTTVIGKTENIVVEGTQTYPLIGPSAAGSYSAPALQNRAKANKDSIWTLSKVKKGFTLKAANKAIRTGGVEGHLYTNAADRTETFSFDPEEGLLRSVTGDTLIGKIGSTGLGYVSSKNAADFVLYLVQPASVDKADMPAGTKELEEITGAMFILNSDGKYVGVSKNTALRATSAARTVTAAQFLAMSEDDQRAFVWVEDNGALRSAFAQDDLYLTANTTTGAFQISDEPVAVSVANSIFSVEGQGATQVSLVSSNVLPPFDGYVETPLEITSDIVLTATGGDVVTSDEDGNISVSGYNESDAAAQIWTLVPYETSKNVYEVRLKNKLTGKFLVLGGSYVTVDENVYTIERNADRSFKKFSAFDYANMILRAGSQYVNGSLAVVPAFNQATYFAGGVLGSAWLTADDLLSRFGEYFTMEIIDENGNNDPDDDVDLTGIFSGNLRPVSSVSYRNGNVDYVYASGAISMFMLVNQDGQILVMNTDEDARLSEGTINHVAPLQLISPKAWALDQAKSPADRIYEAYFWFEYKPGTAGPKVENVRAMYVGGSPIGCYLDKKVPTLVAAQNVDLRPITITINPSQLVKATSWLTKPVYYTVEVINKNKYSQNYGKVLGLDENQDINYVDPSNTDITKPEGQFIITYDEDNKYFIVTNRETGRLSYMYAASNLYKIDDTQFAYLNGSRMDTLAIKPVSNYTSADGFKRISEADLNANTYNVAMSLLDDTYLYTVENHADKHRIGLDREEATNWRIEFPTVRVNDATGDKVAIVPDTVTIPGVITYWANGGWRNTALTAGNKYAKPETYLKVITYVLKNTATEEYLYGKDWNEEKGNAYYVCDESESLATRLALKEVGSAVELIPVMGQEYNSQYDFWYNTTWNSSIEKLEGNDYKTYAEKLHLTNVKIIGGTTSKTGVLKDVDRFSAVSNDLFVIKESAAPTYKKLAQGDKIILSRADNTDEVIYEKGEFAGINNIKAYEKINPALYVDTAYVERAGNYKYQYLLGVNITRVDSTEQCNIPSHAGLHTAYTSGRFLINMADSAVAEADKNVHTNKYMYDGESKLAFVNGIHEHDTLYFTNEAGEVIAKTKVGDAAPHYAKFAFKMIDEAANEFVIETGEGFEDKYVWEKKNGAWSLNHVNGEATKGYLRWHNGNLVVTSDLDQAEHFTLEATDATPTANEAVEAAEVSVVATQGAIIVKGAAGKVVTVANILGQTIANQVAASDNVTIAAPAGIAVVTVDGEVTKVVVK